MSISIIGTGNVGYALAHVFARNKVEALVANTRGPASFRELAADVTPTVRGVELSEALASDLILLAIPFLAVESVGRSRREWSGKTIVDVTNAFMLPNADEVLAGRLSTEIVADAFPGAETVKAFNQLPINVLARDRSGERGKQVVFVSSNSAGASARVAELAERLGFSAIELGRLDEGGRLIQARNALVLRNLIELPMSTDKIAQVVRSYIKLAGHGSADGHRSADEVATLFADNAIFGNPAGGDVHRGIEAIRHTYHSMWDGREQRVDLVSLNVSGREAVVHVQVVFSGQRVDVIDVMTFDEDAKIASLRAYT